MERTPEDMLMREMTDAACAVQSQCMHCQHLEALGNLSGTGWTCPAFPEGIPIDILALGGGTMSRHAHHIAGQAGRKVYKAKVYKTSTGEQYRVNPDWEVEVIR